METPYSKKNYESYKVVHLFSYSIDLNSKFQYDEEISEKVLFQLLCNIICFYKLIINLSFDQEKEL